MEEEKLLLADEAAEKLQSQKTMYEYQLQEARKRIMEMEETNLNLKDHLEQQDNTKEQEHTKQDNSKIDDL